MNNTPIPPTKATRGRPRTLNREHILNVAMYAYWQQGIANVSINEICKQANVSKPGLYREFGNEDGLMKAVLLKYQDKVISRLQQLMSADRPFHDALEDLITFSLTRNKVSPKGCLKTIMRDAQLELGDETKRQLEHTQAQLLLSYADFIERAKQKRQLSVALDTNLIATYIDTQLSSAQVLLSRGESTTHARQLLTLAFSVLR